MLQVCWVDLAEKEIAEGLQVRSPIEVLKHMLAGGKAQRMKA